MITGFESELLPSEYRLMVKRMAETKNMAALVCLTLLYDEETISEDDAEAKLAELTGLWVEGWGDKDTWADGLEEDPEIEPFSSYLTEEELDGEALDDRGYLVCIKLEYVLPLHVVVDTLITHIGEPLDRPVYSSDEERAAMQDQGQEGDKIADPDVVRDLLSGKHMRIDLPEDDE